MGFAGMNTAVSGLRAAQVGLGITGHNMSNAEQAGYSRQRIVQKDFYYNSLGMGANGNPLKRGLGTDWSAISQIRNEFLDYNYRKANAKLSFYSVKSTVGAEIEANFGELQGADNIQSVIQDMWYAIEELNAHPQGVETREFFLATCSSFVTKANTVFNSLIEYQKNLDGQVRGAVDDVNDTVGRIKQLNTIIKINEVAGDNANDYRDERNRLLDRLSELIPINYSYDSEGEVTIFSDGHMVLSNGQQNFFGLRYTADNQGLVEPVLVGGRPQTEILEADTPPDKFEQYINYDKPINSERNNDYGILKGLIVARGAIPAYYPGVDGLKQPQGMPGTLRVVTNPSDANYTQKDVYRNWLTTGTTKTDADISEYLLENNTTVYIDPNTLGDAEYKRVTAIQKTLVSKSQAEEYNKKQQEWSIENCMIPKAMMKLDQVFHSIVTMINDTVAPANGKPVDPDNEITEINRNSYVGPQDPNEDPLPVFGKNPDAPFDNNRDNDTHQPRQSYEEVFVRSSGPSTQLDRWDEKGNLNPEYKGDYFSQYSIGNVILNPDLAGEGYNNLSLSPSGDIEDTTLLNELQQLWKSNTSVYAVKIGGVSFNMDESYNKLVTQMGTEVSEAKSFVDGQLVQTEQAENKRQTIMGVSMDEELSNMMRYQYAYQAAARIVNTIDSMIDKVINGTGRAGL